MKQTAESRKLAGELYALLDRRQKRNFLLILLAMALSAVLTQVTPKAIGWLTDDILLRDQIQFVKVLPVLGVILVVNLANQVVILLRRLLVEDTATKTEKKARGLAIASLLKAPLSFYRENMTGNIHGRLNRCLEGTVRMEKLLFMDFAPAIFNSLAAVAVIFTTLPVFLALPMLLVIPIGVAIVLRQIHTQRGIRVDLLDTKAAMDGSLVELLGGIQVIRVTDSVAAEVDRFDRKSETLRAREMSHHLAMAGYDLLKFLNQVVFTVLMIGVSAWLATRGVITVGAVLTAYLCFNQLLKPLEELHRILDELSESMILAQDFFRMVHLSPDFSYRKITLPSAETKPRAPLLELEGLRLAYGPDREVLRGIDLRVERGTFLGLAGPSGCGKSSLIKAICRLEACEGKLLLEGRELETWSREELARVITLVPQTPFLIAGTIRENICYGLKETPAPEATVAPEADVTPQPEETAAPEEPLVGEALRYQREVVDINHEDYPFDDHLLVIPKINRDGEGAQALNRKIYDTYAPIYEELQEYQEGGRLYYITCTSRTEGDLVGIIMRESVVWQYSEGEVDYTAFYYDATQDRELTFEEYVAALGLDLPTLQEQLLTMEDTGGTQVHTVLGDSPQLTGCIADEEGTTIIVSHVYNEVTGSYSGVLGYNVAPVL